jgi:hypothetical protein
MRELIYLSDPKLRQFVDMRPPNGWRSILKRLSGSIKIPLIEGNLEVTFGTPSVLPSRFESVYENILNSARWYEDVSVESGNWVLFEAKLRYVTGQPDKTTNPVVVFFECVRPGTHIGRKLILHGSARNLTRRKLQSSETKKDVDASNPDRFSAVLDAFSRPSDRVYFGRGRTDERVVSRFLTQHSQPIDYFCSATMSGCARVSAVLQGETNALVASPLFVQNGPEDGHLALYDSQR